MCLGDLIVRHRRGPSRSRSLGGILEEGRRIVRVSACSASNAGGAKAARFGERRQRESLSLAGTGATAFLLSRGTHGRVRQTES